MSYQDSLAERFYETSLENDRLKADINRLKDTIVMLSDRNAAQYAIITKQCVVMESLEDDKEALEEELADAYDRLGDDLAAEESIEDHIREIDMEDNFMFLGADAETPTMDVVTTKELDEDLTIVENSIERLYLRMASLESEVSHLNDRLDNI